MAVRLVSQVFVMHNGKKLEHLQNVAELDEEYRAEVDLMSGSGVVDKARKYKFTVDYAIPKQGAKLDWSDVEDASFTIEYKDGLTVKYSGVDCLSRGEVTFNGQDAAVMKLTFMATGKTIS